MSRNQRLGLVALAVAVAVAAFLILKPGGDDEQKAATTATATTTTAGQETATTETETATKPEQPAVKRIVIKNGKPVGGVRELKFKTGERARIEVRSDAPDELHLHGYDITRNAEPGKPATFSFKARAEGEFELESHTAEHAGLKPLIARVVVSPS